MKHFIDYSSHVSKQTFSAGVIVDNKGKQAGKIVIRFTDSSVGYNHHIGVVFYPAEMSFKDNAKGGTYSQPRTLFKLFSDSNVKCYTHNKLIIDYDSRKKHPDGTIYDSLSRFDEITRLKFKRKSYNVFWAM